jgi:hypothetical protein
MRRANILLTITIIFIKGTTIAAQDQESRVTYGFYGVGEVVHLKFIDPNHSGDPKPGSAWGGGVTSFINVLPKFILASSFGFVEEWARTIWRVPDYPELKTKFRWIDGSLTVLHRPFSRTGYGLMWGLGVSVKYQFDAFHIMPSGNIYDIYEYTHHWSYSLPVQAGADFHVGPRQKIVCLAGFQFGLRPIFKPAEYYPTLYPDPRGQFRLNATTFRVMYFFNIAGN